MASPDYALLAGASYYVTRDEINRFPLPNDWSVLSRIPEQSSGFEAASFQKGTEIVISFAGTYDKSPADMAADAALASGLGTMQLYEAALYYLQVKEINANATISFTGHSLGGGLAALMAVLFDESAVTFDQAPFANAASVAVRDGVVAYLKDKGYSNARLTELAPELLSYAGNGDRIGNVTGEYVVGEMLHSPPFSLFSTIGVQKPLTHGGDASSGDLHSQALLTTFVQSEAFEDMTSRLPDLLKMIFDKNLFAYPTDPSNTKNANILDLLVRHQAGGIGGIPVGGDGMLDRFTADLGVIADAKGAETAPNLGKALVAFAMEAYYNETADSPTRQKRLFDAVTGGLQFNTDAIASDITAAKGYAQYFSAYVETFFTLEERQFIEQQVASIKNWGLATANDASNISATANDAQGSLLLGNVGRDTLTGGAGNDLLAGGWGKDVLDGGSGADTLLGGWGDDLLTGGSNADRLEGGSGNDTYYADEGDTIRDSDGQGTVYLNGKKLTFAIKHKGDSVWKDEAGNTYSLSGGNLQINDPLTIEGFDNGEFGN